MKEAKVSLEKIIYYSEQIYYKIITEKKDFEFFLDKFSEHDVINLIKYLSKSAPHIIYTYKKLSYGYYILSINFPSKEELEILKDIEKWDRIAN